MPSQGCAVRLMAVSLLPSPPPPLRTIHVFPPDGRLRHQVWWHILYTRGRGRAGGRSGREDRERNEDERSRRQERRKRKRENKSETEEEERRDPLLSRALRRAYCVILATVAAATAGIIIISKGRQNTGPESHNAEFYDFWHRGETRPDAQRDFLCSSNSLLSLSLSPGLDITPAKMNVFSKHTSCPTVVGGFVVAVSERARKCQRTRKYEGKKRKVKKRRVKKEKKQIEKSRNQQVQSL